MEGSPETVEEPGLTTTSAEWRLNQATEQEAAQYHRASETRRTAWWLLAIVLLGTCPCMIPVLIEGMVWPLVILCCFLAFCVGTLQRTGRIVSTGQQRRAAFWTDHESIGAWLVDLVVFQGVVPTGRDQGVLWFEEDRLYFLGDRTSFGLSRDQVATFRHNDWVRNDLQRSISLDLCEESPVGPLGIGVEVLAPYVAQSPYRGPYTLVEALRGWIAASEGTDRQLPPLSIGPEAPSSLALLNEAVKNSLVWGALLGAALWMGFASEWWVGVGFAAIVSLFLSPWGAIWTPRLRWRAWRDRRRLDRSASQ